MPLQNRVHPNGEIIATPGRGTMLGNRGGKFHRNDKTLGKRRWATHHWICCELHYKNMHHEPMGQGYTSLFFLDEVTALAAGHRPCFFCRRKEAKQFVELSGMTTDALDRKLHAERVSLPPLGEGARRADEGLEASANLQDFFRQHSRQDPHPSLRATFPQRGKGVEISNLPSGAMIEFDGETYAIHRRGLLRWSFTGYTPARITPSRANLLTPPTIVRILSAGFQPRWHPSAFTQDTP